MNESLSLNKTIANFVLANFGFREKKINSARASADRCAIETTTAGGASTISKKGNLHRRTVGVFLHHRDAKVALEELRKVGFPMSWIALVARQGKRYDWMPGLTVCDRFDEDEFSEAGWQFFQKYYKRGRYLIIIKGTEDAISYAEAILSRRRGRSEVWHL
ncbi:hypothetical protein NIES593_03025 [Hydrococcus rivularis NIES-593]|uniref:Uncharacterized protein n=1 Tax=Hydrococcus rivularis NIES-593 TaxID=1921803 RepID=A0A1U7HRA8_9CYAN|nr:hypothetical protein [Hydrococcus rivularis]OKH26065.1 hypothetical protein NIES593_03025 [Hydrococcus rivularis NIES-593]